MKFVNDPEVLLSDKEILESTYDCKMDVYEWENKDVNGFTEEELVLKYTDVPCGISQMSADLAGNTDVAKVEMKIKVFLSDDYQIGVGSLLKIVVAGESRNFKRVGLAKHYKTHQELIAVSEVY